ncbi:hypothetical protein [Ruminococcus sp.]|uniref:hypothetical protein n=1 Tax=Ruminococcus sp. TaxID=41978 RepID=UPI0025E52207|nr:hypothetical protein [Ruminococcus sp.]MCR4639233.1 hypothetical protein [Ruminococcus sp.]
MMKTNAKRKNSAVKKLIPAAGMLALSASMLATSTYAWFTMNKVVEVTGMELKTKVGSNLLICSDNVEEHYASATLSEGRMGLLEPVSSINGTTGSFWYTVNANARGQKEATATVTQYGEDTFVANAVAGKNAYDKAFNGAYGIHTIASNFGANEVQMIKQVGTSGQAGYVAGKDGAAYGYIDYVFYIKATSDTAAQKLQMTECNMLYNDAAIGTSGTAGVNLDRAWRVGVFVQSLDAATEGGKGNSGETYLSIAQKDPASSASNLKGILALNGATYFTSGQAQTSASALANVVNFKDGSEGVTEGVILDTIANSGTTAYYKVLVRAWLEGEDNTCNSETYAKLTNNWKLNCKFELDTVTTNAVKALNSNAANVASTASTQLAVTSPIEVVQTTTAAGG